MLPRARLDLGIKAISLARDGRVDVVEWILNPFRPELPYVEEEVAYPVIVLVLVEDEELDVYAREGEGEMGFKR